MVSSQLKFRGEDGELAVVGLDTRPAVCHAWQQIGYQPAAMLARTASLMLAKEVLKAARCLLRMAANRCWVMRQQTMLRVGETEGRGGRAGRGGGGGWAGRARPSLSGACLLLSGARLGGLGRTQRGRAAADSGDQLRRARSRRRRTSHTKRDDRPPMPAMQVNEMPS